MPNIDKELFIYRLGEKLEEIKKSLPISMWAMVVPVFFLVWYSDNLYVPEKKWDMLLIRLCIIPIALTSHLLIKRAKSYHQAQYVALFWVVGISFLIHSLIITLGDMSTDYYVGLVLVSIYLVFIPWTIGYFAFVLTLIFGPYLLYSNLYYDQEFSRTISQLMFISGTIMITGFLRAFFEHRGMALAKQNVLRKQAEHKLEKLYSEALSATHEKSRFLAIMSHEIRTPLTSILGYTEILKKRNINKDEKIAAIDTIDSNGKHLLSLINDILDLSKIEENKIDIEYIPVSPLTIIREVEALYRKLIENNGVEFSVNISMPIPISVNSDPTRIRQILLNLLSNANKFTEKGCITLDCHYDNINCQLVICVNDTGVGISEDQSKKLFQPFAQADISTTRKYGGTGLGLNICKRLAKLLGGDLTLSSKLEVGSSFSLILNFEHYGHKDLLFQIPDQDNDHNDRSKMNNYEWYGKKILLVEDSRDIQNLIRLHLKNTGVIVSTANNGQEAVDMVHDEAFDLILMDMQMPIKDGLTASTELREKGNKTIIVALSANAMQEDIMKYKEIGINDFVAKPIATNVLLETINNYIKTSSPISELPCQLNAEDKELLEDLIKEFKSRLPAKINDMYAHLANDDMKNLELDAHTLKGLGGSFGYPKITELSYSIELVAQSHGDPDSIKNSIDKLYEYYTNTIKHDLTI